MSIDKTAFLKDFESLFDEVEPGTITMETTFRDIDEWSSLLALTLIAMADENYDISLTGDDIRNSQTVTDLYSKIEAKL